MLLVLTVLLPLLGVAVSIAPLRRRWRRVLYAAVMLLADGMGLLCAKHGGEISLFRLGGEIRLALFLDGTGRVFLALTLLLYTMSTFYAFDYLKKDRRQHVFFAFWFSSLSAMLAVCMAANLLSFYLCFELATLTTVPLVLHNRTPESNAAALKYLFYSIGGALLGLFAVVTLSTAGVSGFVFGGALPAGARGELLRAAVFAGIVGFGAKAGMFPLHGWLPTAHPVAPAPASALLSGIIVKAGILGVIRLVYFAAGPEMLRDSWAQTAWMVLALVTVFLGSMLAWREKELKKRLAYSTVSQLSYIMLGLSLLSPEGLRAAMLHACAHVCAKGALFLCAGAFIHKLGRRYVAELRGIGRQMPVTVWCFLIGGLSLIGIPPLGGFVSKWQLSLAALDTAPGAFSLLIPVMLVISALLTAGYLLPPVIEAFFPSEGGEDSKERTEASLWMTVPMLLLGCCSLAVGLFGNLLV